MDPVTRLPPLTALRVLEAIRASGSLSGAARLLNHSHSAISYQVSVLESWSPTQLFIRQGRRTELTDAGRSLADATRQAFDSIRHEVDRLPIRGKDVVSIGAIPLAAQVWLPSLLPALNKALPDIGIHLSLALFDRPTRMPPHILIMFAHDERLHASDRVLFSGDAAPVCAPTVLQAFNGDNYETMRSARKIHDEDSRLWRTWSAAAKHDQVEPEEPLRISIEESSLIRAVALAGAGIAVCRLCFIADDLAKGRLIQLSDVIIDTDFKYFLRLDADSNNQPDVLRVANWLSAAANTGV